MSIVLQPGDQAPELELENQDEQLVSLAGLRGHPVIVYFFPEAFSPGCTTEVCDFRDNKAALAAAGYVLLGVSADPPSRLREFRAANEVNHDLLSDPGGATARRWGAWGPKTVNGQATTGPIRSTFIVDAEGVLQSAQYHVDAGSHVDELRRQVGV
ncbi:MAG TPA: peroxiredoxin [Propionibacteriaceae bacterium]|jgi:peroxiredoxin Q/BCP|nr:peroxiredoxin [Propionibacteriaceae bacterium]